LLRDLLDGDGAAEVRSAVAGAAVVVTSRVTLAEVSRVLTRLRVLEPDRASKVASREAAFQSEHDLWAIQPVDDAVWERCGRPFPVEPVRLLDAVHLATIEQLSAALPKLVILSTDARVRKNATAMGFAVRPGDPAR
jgi:predicted nucleic acid-binding protein